MSNHAFALRETRTFWCVGGICTCVLMLLAACGSSNGSAGGPKKPTITPSISVTSASPGCPELAAPAGLGTPAAVLTGGNASRAATITAGSFVQVRLSTSYRWAIDDISTGLTVMDPGGYYDRATNSCTWNVQAAQSGTFIISFMGTPQATDKNPMVGKSPLIGLTITATT